MMARNKRAQFALEYLLTHLWMIFIIILALGILGFYLASNTNYAIQISNSIKSSISGISGFALFSQEEVEIPSQVSQNSYMEIIINPTSKGIYKFAYIYDEKDNLKQVFSFDCEDICKDKISKQVYINNSYLGNYYLAIFDYKQEKYIKKDFEVVEETKLAVGQTKLNFQAPVYLGSNKFMQFYKPNGNNGSNAWFAPDKGMPPLAPDSSNSAWQPYAPGDYQLISEKDENFANFTGNSSLGSYESSYFRYNIFQEPSQITQMDIYFKGYSSYSPDGKYTGNVYIYNFKNNVWDLIGKVPNDKFFATTFKKTSIIDTFFIDHIKKTSNGNYMWIVFQGQITIQRSCPFVYSYDGQDYRFDHEGFPFAIIANSEYASYGRLANLREVDGKYRVKIGERLDETSFVNGFKLYAVDHPGNGTVIPDTEGKPHTIKEQIKPLSCKDKEGNDCLEAVGSLDDRYWQSALDSSKPENYYDWINLEFANLKNAKKVKLVINIRAGKGIVDKANYFVSLIGENYWNEFQELLKEPLLSKLYKNSVEKNNNLQVQIWNGREWKTLGSVGAGESRDSEFLFVLNTTSENIEKNIKVRLKSPTNFFSYNQAYVDYSDDEEMKIQELEPESALKDKENVISKLEDFDDNNYVTLDIGQDIDLVYKTPEKNGNRDFFVSIKGYYNYKNFGNRTFSEFLEGAGIWLKSIFDESPIPKNIQLKDKPHHTIYIDYTFINVTYFGGGTSEIKNVSITPSTDIFTAREDSFQVDCTPDTGEGISTGLSLQFSLNISEGWFNMPLNINTSLVISEFSDYIANKLKTVPKISIQELKENKDQSLRKEWVRVYFKSEKELDYIISIQPDVYDYTPKYIEAVLTTREIEKLKEQGIEVEILLFNRGDVFSGSGFTDYHTYLQMIDDMKAVEGNYSNIAKMYGIGKSIENRTIWALKISDNVAVDEDEPEILITGNHHAREVMTVEIPLYEMHYLVENYNKDYKIKRLVDSREIWIVPTVNPDGHVYVEQNDSMWRNNRRLNSGGTYGVDLNRNYGYMWGYDNVGSSPTPGAETYRGTSAFSEPETQVIRDFTNSHNISYALSYHSYGELFLYSWGYITATTPDQPAFAGLAKGMTSNLPTYKSGVPGALLYTTNGDFDDWMYGEQTKKNKVFGVTFEVNNNNEGFRPDTSLIIPTCEQHIPPFLYLLQTAGAPVESPLESDVESLIIDVSDSEPYAFSVKAKKEGEYWIKCLLFNASDEVSSGFVKVSVLVPSLNLSIINSGDREVVKGSVFDFKINISCSDFDCGNISAYLDPESSNMAQASSASSSSAEIKENYHFNKPSIEKYGKYDKVVIEGLNSIAEPGAPELPFRTIKILLPPSTNVDSVTVTPSGRTYLGDGFFCKPGDTYVPLCDTGKKYEEAPLSTIYNITTPYPDKPYSEYRIEKMNGYRVLLMNIYPVQYNPSRGEFYYYTDIEVNVKSETPMHAFAKSAEKDNYRGLKKDRDKILNLIDNKERVQEYITSENIFKTSSMLSSLPGNLEGESYDYVIITSDAFKNSDFTLLAGDKNSRGVKTKIVTVEEIEAGYTGRDRQEKVRNFIKDAYQNLGIEYVLLGGDRNVIPARKLHADAGKQGGAVDEVPADLYYATLDGNWDANGNGIFGELGEEDWFAEVYVGRAAVRNTADISNFVRKTLSYQSAVGSPHDKDIMIAGENLWMDNCYHEPGAPKGNWGCYYLRELIDLKTANNLTTQGFQSEFYNIDDTTLCDDVKVKNNQPAWTTSEIMAEMNKGINILNHLGHGSPDNALRMTFSNIDALTNDYYFIGFSQSCSSGRFDDTECMAQRFTVASHGAVAYIGNSRYGWGIRGVNDGGTCATNGPDNRQQRFWVDEMAEKNIHTLGKAYQKAKEDDVDYILTGPDCAINWPCRGVQRWVSFSHNLFGDPELRVHIMGIVVNSLEIEPNPIGLYGKGRCIADIAEYNPDANISYVNFTVINPNSQKIINNLAGERINDTSWKSAEFDLDTEGAWTCFVEGADTKGGHTTQGFVFFPGEKGGLISISPEAVPFYTLDNNPDKSCSLKKDESCIVNWRVIPTGDTDTVWNLFAYVNSPRVPYLTATTEKVKYTILQGTGLFVKLLNPENNVVISEQSINFKCSVQNYSTEVREITLYTDVDGWKSVYSVYDKNELDYNLTMSANRVYKWNCVAYDSEGKAYWGAINRTFDYRWTPCHLTNATWSKTSAVLEENVNLNVQGTNCLGKEINYTIWKNIPWWFDKKMFSTSSSASTTWNAGKKSDGSFETGNYYFIAELEDDTSVSVNSHSNGDLNVKTACVDTDKDGYNVTGGECGVLDCNDNNANIKPGATELCNEIDDNCVNGIDENNGECSGSKPYCSDGACVQCTNNSQCDDGLFCNGQEKCNAGTCNAGIAPAINDGISCTIDSCDEAFDNITHAPQNSLCDDGLYCNGQGFCNALSGCSQVNAPNCSDSISCTVDSCSEGSNLTDNSGNCVHNISSCQCTKNSDCNDNNPCTNDICKPDLTCSNTINNSGTCDDGLFCTVNDRCSAGSCVGNARNVSDLPACTIDSCDETNDKILHIPNNTVCSDNLFCNGQEICDALSGCKAGQSPDCNDDMACTTDSCNETLKKCEHKEIEYPRRDLPLCIDLKCNEGVPEFFYNNSMCIDNDICTINEKCTMVGCKSDFNIINQTCADKIKNCTDSDYDGVLDYNTLTCPNGKDVCIVKKINLTSSDMSSLKPKANWLNISFNQTADLRNLSEFKIFKENIAEIKFMRRIDFVRVNSSGCFEPLNIDPLVKISDKKISISSESFNEFNKLAVITFYNISFTQPKIKRDGVECSDCKIVSYDSGSQTLVIEVQGFSEYEVVEGYTTSTLGLLGSSGGGGGGGGAPVPKASCTENWKCSEWSECLNGMQTRTCNDNSQCNTTLNKPSTLQNCIEPEEEKPAAGIFQPGQIVQTLKLNLKLVIGVIAGILVIAAVVIFFVVRRRNYKKKISVIPVRATIKGARKKRYRDQKIKRMSRNKR